MQVGKSHFPSRTYLHPLLKADHTALEVFGQLIQLREIYVGSGSLELGPSQYAVRNPV